MEHLVQLSERSIARLEQLESDWLQGQIPNVASYLSQSESDDPRSWRDLVELDLEYRWRRFEHGTSVSDLDPFGFPLYPKLEHYAGLMEESVRAHLLNPELLAEEYRVRTFWGDRPDKTQYLERLPEDSESIKSAIDHIDLELEIEGMSTRGDDQRGEEITQLFDQQSDQLHETFPGTDVPTRIGKYRMEGLLGRGGFGEVWKAFDPDLKRHVALKFPHPHREVSAESYQTFCREAEKMAALERVPGVVPVYDAGEHEGLPYIASMLIDGEDLSVRQKRASLSFEESARIAADVSDTLHRAHLKDLFHRDVKLSNILIDQEEQVFLSDFGLCVSEQEQLHEGHSATGTYAYMAPEQVQGNSHRVDGRTDIYALGVVLYRLLSGRLPFIGKTSVEYMEQTLKKSPRPPRSIDDQIPEELERICMKCLNKKVEDRYATASDLARDLRNWITSLTPEPAIEASQATALPQRAFSQRHPFLMMFAMLLIALGGFFASKSELFRDEVVIAAVSTEPPNPPTVGPLDNVLSDAFQGDVIYLADASPSARLKAEDEAEWVILDGFNAVEVKPKLAPYALISIGQLNSGDSYDIQVDLLEMPLGTSGGLFYGMSDPLMSSKETYWQSVVVEREADGSFRLLREFYAVKYDFPRNYSHFAHDIKIEAKDVREITLRIKISEEGLQEISVNGESYDDLAEDFRTHLPKRMKEDEQQNIAIPWASPEHVRGTGSFGLTSKGEKTIFANSVINNVSREFKLSKQD